MNGSKRACTVRICWTTSANVCGLVVCCLPKSRHDFRIKFKIEWTHSASIKTAWEKQHKITYEFEVDWSSLDSFALTSDGIDWFVEVEPDELLVEFDDDIELDDVDVCVLAPGLWVTPMTRTVGLPEPVAFISIVGTDAAPSTNGIGWIPPTESSVMFVVGNPF